jgi:hypothetical protein
MPLKLYDQDELMQTLALGPEPVPEQVRTRSPSKPPPNARGEVAVELGGRDLPLPVVPGDVAAHHPVVGEALVDDGRDAEVVALAVAVGEDGAAASGDARLRSV